MNKNEIAILNEKEIEDKVYIIRGIPVMLDRDLALIYGYEVKRLNEQVKNNIEKFPSDMMFQLTKEDLLNSRSKISTLNYSTIKQGKNIKYYPYAFTEQGIYMLMTVLKINKHLKRKTIDWYQRSKIINKQIL